MSDEITQNGIDKSELIVSRVLNELEGRKGIGDILKRIEFDTPDIYEGLVMTLENIVRECLDDAVNKQKKI